MTDEQALAFANKHVAIWNAHDLEQIMSLYAEQAELHSPLAEAIMGARVVRGKPKLREYFARALARYPTLRFELLNTLRGVDSVTLYFKSIRPEPVAEVIFLDVQGKIVKVLAHYSC